MAPKKRSSGKYKPGARKGKKDPRVRVSAVEKMKTELAQALQENKDLHKEVEKLVESAATRERELRGARAHCDRLRDENFHLRARLAALTRAQAASSPGTPDID